MSIDSIPDYSILYSMIHCSCTVQIDIARRKTFPFFDSSGTQSKEKRL